MIFMNVNRKLLLLKLCFFLLFASYAPICGFLPTVAKQLGYSMTTYGVSMTITTVLLMISTLFFSVIIDKFRLKKKLFTIFLVGVIVSSFCFIFVPKLPSKAIVELKCFTKTVITAINTDNYPQTSQKGNKSIAIRDQDNEKLITCKLDCEEAVTYGKKLESCDDWTALDLGVKYKHVYATFKLNDTDIEDNLFDFHLLTVQINGTDEQLPTTCRCPLKTSCQIDCNDDFVMEVATVKTYRGNVLNLYQFWIFFALLAASWTSIVLLIIFVNPICLDILEENSVDYGKQKLWGSIGWGIFSILGGWIVDLYSFGKKEKDYTPIYVSCIILTICNLIVITKMKIVETKKSNSTRQNVYGLFTKCYVILFIIWSVLGVFFHAIITHFLFWYMEDMVSVSNDPDKLVWLKTVQGIAQGVQCFAGEIPFFFWSGWIIKKIGYTKCMALVLGAMAVRMYLYTIISNPIWIVLIELLNGVSFALGFALKMSYVKMIAPPDKLNTIIGCIAFFDLIGESFACSLGGYVFDSFGGVRAFRFFAVCSALACCLNMLANFFGLIKDTMDIVNMNEKLNEKNVNSLELTSTNPIDQNS